MSEKGAGNAELTKLLESIGEKAWGLKAPLNSVTPEPKIETPVVPPPAKEMASVGDYFASQGFTYMPGASTPEYVTYKKGDNKVTMVVSGPSAGTWDSSSPGHISKKGKGLDSLKALMAGKPKDPANGITWENTKPAVTPVPPPQAKPHVELHKEIQKATAPPQPGQKAAVSHYKGNGYHQINDCLRHQTKCDDPKIDKITEWLNRQELPKDITVYRGVSAEYAKILRTIAIPGMKFREKGFLSTSTSPEFGKSWGSGQLFLTINAPKGSKAGTIVQEGMDHEYEILFQRNSIFEVASFDEKTGYMTLNLVSQEPVGSTATQKAA
jgi:hypothetical protein